MILRKISQFLLVPLLISFALQIPGRLLVITASSRMQESNDPYTLIAEVNALRAANGLPALVPDPILMAVSQAHAEYMASSGVVTHYSADGSRPYQRSLAAGYPVAGDLSLGGFHSENIIAGTNMTPAQAVSAWTGDEPHLNTMLSPQYKDIGAGVAIVGSKVYYVIDTSRKSGSSAVVYTPPVVNGTQVYNLNPLVSTIFPNTPAADGTVIHTVKPGETLWLIAITYGTKIDSILQLNNLPKDSPIYPGQELLIRNAVTTIMPTPLATFTTVAISRTPSIIPVIETTAISTDNNKLTPESSTKKPSTVVLPIVITVGALTLAAVVAISSGRRKHPS